MTLNDHYNGWTNWETWNTNLWMEEGVGGGSEYWRERAAAIVGGMVGKEMGDAIESGMWEITPEGLYEATYTLGTEMKDAVLDDVFEGAPYKPGLADDLLNDAIGRINWSEIASHYTEAICQVNGVVKEALDVPDPV